LWQPESSVAITKTNKIIYSSSQRAGHAPPKKYKAVAINGEMNR
jgi:hypothetical protein